MNTLETQTVANLVTENIKTAHIFKKYGIDFCCGGGISIQKAAEKANVSYKDLEKDLLNIENTASKAYNYNKWELDFLIDHIINTHHAYVEENLPLISQYADRVLKVHGHYYPELLEIKILFDKVARELTAHCNKEELILFPFIKKMMKAKIGETSLPENYGTIEHPIALMKADHEEVGDILKEIQALSNDYTLPEGACNTYKAFYAKLDEFQQDLHLHVHLENNILFPKALELKSSLNLN